ncbi:hypothetical protein P5V15_000391 [Pogonomyrmex californicus]
MKQVIFILSLFTIIILGFTDDVTNRLAELLSMSKIDVEICMNKTSVNINDLMKLDELVDDDIMTKDINDAALKVGCLFVCLLQKKDIMSGVYINVEKMKKILDIKMHSKNMFRYVVMRNRILDTCADRVKSKTDECEVILIFYLCINAEVPDFSNAVYKRSMFSEQLYAVRSERSMFSERTYNHNRSLERFRIMKQAIFILCLCIAITVGQQLLEDVIDKVADDLSMSKTDVQICFTKSNVNLTDLMKMDEFFWMDGEMSAEINKSTLKVSCLLACLLKKKELMVNTQINVKKIKKLIAAKGPSDPTTIYNQNRILDTCVDRVKGKTNECDVILQLLLCIVEKLKKLRMIMVG